MATSKTPTRRDWMRWTAGGAVASPLLGQGHPEVTPLPGRPHVWTRESEVARRVTLEMSLKPFRKMEEGAIRAVCEQVFRQWEPLLRRASETAVMLWTADGSEILTYRGHLEDEIEWCRYIGSANPPRLPPTGDPSRISIHARARLYMEDPPTITYRWLKTIVSTLKSVGESVTGKPVTVGATFDPGPEFARSPFKYQKHPEILGGYWVDCSAALHADSDVYAGFPNGIPEGTPFGKFFGRQTQRFLTDLGFDYIWFSNGFGFSVTAWSVQGSLFDGQNFHPEKAAGIRERILSFWKIFRQECPAFPVETRGSNLTTGSDLSASASPIADIYDGNFNMVAPPNSPWAAIDGDFGVEIVGYLSHIAHLPPGDRFPFRFYTHDPWWLNSPWFDRYGREPHDIYLPLSVSRISAEAKVTPPSFIEFLTIDNSYGEMPDECPNEVIPHILAAMKDFSDEPGPLTWLYPFREYHQMVFGSTPDVPPVFFGDWFMRNAVNAGFPLNSVVSTDNFLASLKVNSAFYRDTILLTPVPAAGSLLERAILERLRAGQSVFLYGPVSHASQTLLDLLNLKLAEPISGEMEIHSPLAVDVINHGRFATKMLHRDALSAGGVDTVLNGMNPAGFEVCATVSNGSGERVFAVTRKVDGGRLAWARGSFACTITRAYLPKPDDPRELFQSEYLMRWMLSYFGYELRVERPTVETRHPLMLVSRSNNGLFFSGYCPSTTAAFHLRFPDGAPLLVGCETWFEGGRASYSMPRAWRRECRCFVNQAETSEISCVEAVSEELGIRRRLRIRGLKQARVTFYPELRPAEAGVRMETGGKPTNFTSEEGGRRLVATGVSGDLLISW